MVGQFWKTLLLVFLAILSKVESSKTEKLKDFIPTPQPEVSVIPEICDEKYRYENATPDYMYSPTPERLGKLVKAVLPPIGEINTSSKGGKVIVVGGSIRNPGALYRTAMTAVLLAGPTKVIVITTLKIAHIVMGYGPDLTVYPYMSESYQEVTNNLNKIEKLFTQDDIVVLGPGGSVDTLEKFIDKEYTQIPLNGPYILRPFIINSAALIFTDDMGIKTRIKRGSNGSRNENHKLRYRKLIQLCNYKELRSVKRYFQNANSTFTSWSHVNQHIMETAVMKGKIDYFFNLNLTVGWALNEGGTGNRAAGQGDIFAGVFAVFLNWALATDICNENNKVPLADSVAAYAASRITRRANELGVQRFRHGMTSTKMMRFVWKALTQLFIEDEGVRSPRSEL